MSQTCGLSFGTDQKSLNVQHHKYSSCTSHVSNCSLVCILTTQYLSQCNSGNKPSLTVMPYGTYEYEQPTLFKFEFLVGYQAFEM